MSTPAVSAPSGTPATAPPGRTCRFCGAPLEHTFVDLGMSPLCESYLRADQLDAMEPFYPLHVSVCGECFLVQVPEYVGPAAIFGDYAYFSSYSDTWLQHARRYVEMMITRFALGPRSQVVEVASNDGYLLQYFVARGIPVLGVEPAANVAAVAVERGIPSRVEFFGRDTAAALVESGVRADLLIGNNVLAQVPDLNSFVAGLQLALAAHGVLTLEFPHLWRLMEGNQFDTIYHEHFSYFSFLTVTAILATHGLTAFDVEELPTHGGSLRVFACRDRDARHPISPRVGALRDQETAAGFARLEHYLAFTAQVQTTKRKLLRFLIDARDAGQTVAGYGAPGKGNTLLNYCGIRGDLLAYTVDRSPHKQGKFLPGTHIPIFSPARIAETRPDYLLILPWNVKDEIMQQMAGIRAWGGQFVVPIPQVQVFP